MNDIIVERCWYDDDNDKVYRIRFVKVGDLWYAVLKDICDALGLDTWHVSQRIPPMMLLKRNIPEETPLKRGCPISGQHRNGYIMTLVSEHGIIRAIGSSDRVEARKFEMWWTEMIIKFRQAIGLEGFQVMDMLDTRVQQHITRQVERFLPEFEQYDDSIFYDEETGKLMKSVTLPGGDVEVVEYDGEDYQVIPY